MQLNVVLRVLLFRDPYDQSTWIAQAIDHDIAAHGADIDEAKRAFIHTVEGYVMLADKHNQEPLANLKPAPQPFRDIWNRLAEESRVERMAPAAFMLPVVTYDTVSTQ